MRIVFLSSGGGGTIKFLNIAKEILDLDFNIEKIICDRECGSYEYARQNGINTSLITYTRDHSDELREVLRNCEFDLTVTLIKKIIDKDTINLYPNKFINLHYSILPAYRGTMGMQSVEQAKINNVQFIGATSHFVDEHVDNGKIIQQCSIPVNWKRDINEIKQDVFMSGCLVFLNTIIMLSGKSKINNQNEYFLEKTRFYFNPGLSYDPLKFKKEFWDRVKH